MPLSKRSQNARYQAAAIRPASTTTCQMRLPVDSLTRRSHRCRPRGRTFHDLPLLPPRRSRPRVGSARFSRAARSVSGKRSFPVAERGETPAGGGAASRSTQRSRSRCLRQRRRRSGRARGSGRRTCGRRARLVLREPAGLAEPELAVAGGGLPPRPVPARRAWSRKSRSAAAWSSSRREL